MTDDQLGDIEERAEKVTKTINEPWEHDFKHGGDHAFGSFIEAKGGDTVLSADHGSPECFDCEHSNLHLCGFSVDVLDFIAHSRTDIPALIAEVRRLRAINRRLVKALKYIKSRIYGIEINSIFIEARNEINAAIEAARG